MTIARIAGTLGLSLEKADQLAILKEVTAKGLISDEKITNVILEYMTKKSAAPLPTIRDLANRFDVTLSLKDNVELGKKIKAQMPQTKEQMAHIFSEYVFSERVESQPQSPSAPNKDGDKSLGFGATSEQIALIKEISQLDSKTYPSIDSFKDLLVGTSSKEVTQILTAIHKSLVVPPSTKGGFYNVGNTCWFNSCIQTFFKTNSPYRELFLRQAKGSEGKEDHVKRARALFDIITLSEKANRTVSDNQKLQAKLRNFVDVFYKSTEARLLLGRGHQEDAHEGLKALVEYLGLDQLKGGVPSLNNSNVAMSCESDAIGEFKAEQALPIILRHGEKIASARSIQELVDRASMSTEHLAESESLDFGSGKEQTLSVNFLSPKDKLPEDIIIEVPRFKLVGFNRQKDHSHIHFDPLIEVPCYDTKGRRVLKVLKLQLKNVVCHLGDMRTGKKGEDESSGHYVTVGYNSLIETNPGEDGPRAYSYLDDETCYHGYRGKSVIREDTGETMEQFVATKGYLATYHLVEAIDPEQEKFETVDTIKTSTLMRPDSGTSSLESNAFAPVVPENIEERYRHSPNSHSSDEEYYSCDEPD